MFRNALIMAATLLAGSSVLFARRIPTRADMKLLAYVVTGIGFFFMLFFTVVRFIDDYFWWSIPAVAFILVFHFAIRALDRINVLINRGEPKEKLVQQEQLDAMLWDDAAEPPDGDFEPGRPRRFLDDYLIADEADLGPTALELKRLDEFIFTARHGYLVHDHDPDLVPCDVLTVAPGMSVADLIEAAQQHQCRAQSAEQVAA
jgi:hypothetical protein